MSLESEQALVAAAIVSAEQFDAVSQVVTSHDLIDNTCRVIFDAVAAMREIGREVDLVTLSAVLDKSSRWQALELGPSIEMVNALIEASQSLSAVMVYADIVKQASINRQLLDVSQKVRELSQMPDLSADQKLGQAFTLFDPLTKNAPDGFKTYTEAAREAIWDINKTFERGDGLSGLSTGFNALDDITAGLQDSNLIYIGARPSMGKTMLGMCIANHVAKTESVLVFSLEMPRRDLAKRTLSSFSGIHMSDIAKGNMSEQSWPLLSSAVIETKRLDLHIDDSAGLHIDQIRTRARIASRRKKPKLILLDYLTLIRGNGDTSHLEVSYVSKSLKAMAKELECPVLCLAQLNRGLESRTDKRPKLSDLRESGSIEEDADVVMFLYRDEVYDEDSNRKGIAELNIAKNRNGPIGVRYLKSELQYQRFVELTSAVPPIEKKQKASPLKGLMGNSAINHAEGF